MHMFAAIVLLFYRKRKVFCIKNKDYVEHITYLSIWTNKYFKSYSSQNHVKHLNVLLLLLFFFVAFCCFLDPTAVLGRVVWIRVSSSVLSGSFLGIGSRVFSETQHGVMALVVLCVAEPDFLKKKFLPRK